MPAWTAPPVKPAPHLQLLPSIAAPNIARETSEATWMPRVNVKETPKAAAAPAAPKPQ